MSKILNTGDYCWVNEGAVVEGPQKLPQNWTHPVTGQSYSNLDNVLAWSDPSLLAIGWYPYVLVDSGTPGPYYTRSLGAFQIQATEVTQVASYTQWDIENIRTSKNTELQNQLRSYTLQDKALNDHVEGYMRDDAQWLSVEQANLARLETWEEVAAFDTAKPVVIAFANNYTGQKLVEEGYKLTAENQAAVGAGQSAVWDQTIIDSFVSANQLAAQDSSGSQAPANPTYQIRQGVGVPNEQFARTVIFRTSREDPNPALRTTYKVRMYNRQDSRPLYVFSYFNSTFLAWHPLEDLGDGVWGFEAHSSEWQWVPNDMHFIFSYGTNQAEEAKYFTDRIDFPAGVDHINFLVAWDPQ